jgi:hypothetical protein
MNQLEIRKRKISQKNQKNNKLIKFRHKNIIEDQEKAQEKEPTNKIHKQHLNIKEPKLKTAQRKSIKTIKGQLFFPEKLAHFYLFLLFSFILFYYFHPFCLYFFIIILDTNYTYFTYQIL